MKKGFGEGSAIFTLHFNNSATAPQTIFNKRLMDSVLLPTLRSAPIRFQIDSTLSSPPEDSPGPLPWMEATQDENHTCNVIC